MRSPVIALLLALAGASHLRMQWPEYVGATAADAVADLSAEHPNMHIDIVLAGTMHTMQHRDDRIIITVDANGIVTRPPRIG